LFLPSIAYKVVPSIEVRKRFIPGNLDTKKGAQGFPALFYLVDQQLFGRDSLLNIFVMLFEDGNSMLPVIKLGSWPPLVNPPAY